MGSILTIDQATKRSQRLQFNRALILQIKGRLGEQRKVLHPRFEVSERTPTVKIKNKKKTQRTWFWHSISGEVLNLELDPKFKS